MGIGQEDRETWWLQEIFPLDNRKKTFSHEDSQALEQATQTVKYPLLEILRA